eukprot:COSAG05_NODE_831_length_7083_cov_166.649055_8_plen_92_part_00
MDSRKFERAARSLPRASTTWTPTALVKLAEWAVSFQWRDEFAKALMGDTGMQVGVGVPGGQQLVTLAVEALLRENPELRALNLDIAIPPHS